MNNILNEFIQDPTNDIAAFELAEYYYERKQWAAASSFYTRVTENSTDDDLIYESLLKSGLCYEKMTDRYNAIKGLYMNAMSHLPKRPESYFLLSRLYRQRHEYREIYLLTNIGLNNCDFNYIPLKTDIEYPGKYSLYFEKAIAARAINRLDESINLFLDLYEGKYGLLNETYINEVKYNIELSYGVGNWNRPIYYDKSKTFKFPFNDIDKIDKNYSQVFQDMFVLAALNGKTNGTYLEIGSHEPITHSNTYLLEKKFGWKGISLEIDHRLVISFNGSRKNTCYHKDATTTNYTQLLDNQNWGYEWDYLQIDCEPSKNTFEALLSIPLDKYKFAVITYEHDYYCDDTKSYREKSRNYLHSHGYKLIVNDIAADDVSTFEDWWVHPNLIDEETINKLQHITDTVNKAAKYILLE